MFVIAIIAFVIATVALVAAFFMMERLVPIIVTVVAFIVGFVFMFFSTYYTQEAGEAKVLRDWTGNIVGMEAGSGGHWKEPWVDTVDWNIRNQSVMFTGDGTTTHEGQEVTGAQITFTDKEGVTGNLDLAVIYSIDAAKVESLTFDYTDQNDFTVKVVENDVKSLPRDILAGYTTIRAYNERAEVRSKIEEGLRAAWTELGVSVERVQVHGIRYPEEIEARFVETQNANTAVVKAKAELEKARIDAEQKVVQAEAEAKANATLSKSLTPEVLRQRYLDTLAKLAEAGNLVITDGESQVLVQP